LDIFVGMILLGLVLSDQKTLVSKFFSITPFRILGQISYSFYLIHASIGIPLAFKYFKVKNFDNMILFWLWSFFVCYVISTIIFFLFERFAIGKLSTYKNLY
jgi:peptidoglycan/LPS O-acetylase OafA/YrhL